jgi:hypothetical protein
MNERIKQLAEQAREYAEWSTPQGLEWFDNFKEQFAELIVRECMEVCADRGKRHGELYSAWASDCSERIGKRFGVE